jgi:hypothetical protein
MIYDTVYEELSDPIEYFVEKNGMYSEEDLLKQTFITYDIDKICEDAVSEDGVAHFLARYDGEENEQTVDGKTYYFYRFN